MRIFKLTVLFLMISFSLSAQEAKEISFNKDNSFSIEKGKTYWFKFKVEAGKEYTITYGDSDNVEHSMADTEVIILREDANTIIIGEAVDLNQSGNSHQKGKKIKAAIEAVMFVKIEGISDGKGSIKITPS